MSASHSLTFRLLAALFTGDRLTGDWLTFQAVIIWSYIFGHSQLADIWHHWSRFQYTIRLDNWSASPLPYLTYTSELHKRSQKNMALRSIASPTTFTWASQYTQKTSMQLNRQGSTLTLYPTVKQLASPKTECGEVGSYLDWYAATTG